MRPQTKDVPLSACECARCKVAAVGLSAGPYTPAEYALIAPPVTGSSASDPVSSDPAVVAAEQARDDARSVFDVMNAQWEVAVAEHRAAELRSDPYVRNADGDLVGYRTRHAPDPRIADLAEREKEAREARDTAWRSVVKSNERLRLAQIRARVAPGR